MDGCSTIYGTNPMNITGAFDPLTYGYQTVSCKDLYGLTLFNVLP